MSYVYAIGAIVSGSIESVKIGVTGSHPDKRLATLQTGNHRKLVLLYALDVEKSEWAYDLEGSIHENLKNFRQNGEWFSASFDVLKSISKTFCNNIKDASYSWQPSSFYEKGEI